MDTLQVLKMIREFLSEHKSNLSVCSMPKVRRLLKDIRRELK